MATEQTIIHKTHCTNNNTYWETDTSIRCVWTPTRRHLQVVGCLCSPRAACHRQLHLQIDSSVHQLRLPTWWCAVALHRHTCSHTLHDLHAPQARGSYIWILNMASSQAITSHRNGKVWVIVQCTVMPRLAYYQSEQQIKRCKRYYHSNN